MDYKISQYENIIHGNSRLMTVIKPQMKTVSKQKCIFMLRGLISHCQKADLDPPRGNFQGFMGLTVQPCFSVIHPMENTQL